jgi:hypothetical protein
VCSATRRQAAVSAVRSWRTSAAICSEWVSMPEPHVDVVPQRGLQLGDLLRVGRSGQGAGEAGLPAGGGRGHALQRRVDHAPRLGRRGRFAGHRLPQGGELHGQDARRQGGRRGGGGVVPEGGDGAVQLGGAGRELVAVEVAQEVLVAASPVLPDVDDPPVDQLPHPRGQVERVVVEQRQVDATAQDVVAQEAAEFVGGDAGQGVLLLGEQHVDDEPVLRGERADEVAGL